MHITGEQETMLSQIMTVSVYAVHESKFPLTYVEDMISMRWSADALPEDWRECVRMAVLEDTPTDVMH